MTRPNERNPEDLTLNECIQRLGQINHYLTHGSTDVEEALERFQEGIVLHRRAESILASARLRVEELLRPAESAPANDQGEPI